MQNFIYQDFSIESIKEVLTEEEKKSFNSKKLNIITDKIKNGSFSLSIENFETFNINGKEVSRFMDDYLVYVYRYLNKIIRRIYNIKFSTRNFIIETLKETFNCHKSLGIIKTDIKDFYETIPSEVILNSIKEDMLLNKFSLLLLDNLFKVFSNNKGLPRGISISATLSEIYIKKFDDKLNKNENIFYYFRYVDDIIMLVNENKMIEIKKTIKKELTILNLNCNYEKTMLMTESLMERKGFDYLGYHFLYKKNNKKRNEIVVSISDNRIKRQIRRIIVAFRIYINEYKSDEAFCKLENSIKYLSMLYKKSNNTTKELYIGLASSYSLVNDVSNIKKIDSFYYGIVGFNKSGREINRVGKMTKKYLTIDQRKILSKYSFYKSFVKREICEIDLKYLELLSRKLCIK